MQAKIFIKIGNFQNFLKKIGNFQNFLKKIENFQNFLLKVGNFHEKNEKFEQIFKMFSHPEGLKNTIPPCNNSPPSGGS